MKPISVFLIVILGLTIACNHQRQGETNVATLVNPFVGTDGHGHTFLPFGIVQLSPDTHTYGTRVRGIIIPTAASSVSAIHT